MTEKTANNFIKLNYNYIANYECDKLIQSYGNSNNDKWHGSRLYSIINEKSDKLWNLIPIEFHNDFCLRLLKISGRLVPHIDGNRLCTINAYIKPDSSITTYYSVNENVMTRKIDSQINESLFNKITIFDDISLLTSLNAFIAYPTEVYLLDVTVPHGVHRIDNGPIEERIIMSLQSNTKTFNQVLDMLTI
jgi:hypothetical protein